jgi:hypothetical protein
VLEEADPRGPRTDRVEGEEVLVARELVRVNHHESCMLCHPPARKVEEDSELFTGEIPVPTEKLPPPQAYYSKSKNGLRVRVDVTYLRQDFSVLLPVPDAAPWPEAQRFDFLVRKRVLSGGEARLLREALTPAKGDLTPYQKAALGALREVTGRHLEADAAAWREALGLRGKE